MFYHARICGGNHGIVQMTEPSTWAALVPELLISDIAKSLRFWRDVCGFMVLFDRPDEGFAHLDLDGAQIMLDEISGGCTPLRVADGGLVRSWLSDSAPIPRLNGARK
jgi:hypothetical protein